MKLEQLLKVMSNVKKGSFIRFSYKTTLPVKAEYKNQGYSIVKITSITTRFGINYGNIKAVQERKVEEGNKEKTNRKNNSIWIMKNSILYNENTKKYYLCTYPTSKGKNTSSKYYLVKDNKEEEQILDNIKNMVIDSYWTKKATQMFNVDINNIISIGGYVG